MKRGTPVWIHRGGHASPKPGHYRWIKGIFLRAESGLARCRLEQNDPGDTVGWNKKGFVGMWTFSCIKTRVVRIRRAE